MGSMPNTCMAAISSRMVRAPRSAQIAVPPAPATTTTVTKGPICWTEAIPEIAPERSRAPRSPSNRLTSKMTRRVNPSITRIVGMIETRVMNHACRTASRQENFLVNMMTSASSDMAAMSPRAATGLAMRRLRELIESPPAARQEAFLI